MFVIEAPEPFYDSPPPKVFLAGSIEMGKAVDWQTWVIEQLTQFSGTILNPRRGDWDSSWKQEINNLQFRKQVEWELSGLEDANQILLYFDPDTKSPITLLELGLFCGPKLIVCCPNGFHRKGNVDIVCAYYGIKQVSTLEQLVKEYKIWR